MIESGHLSCLMSVGVVVLATILLHRAERREPSGTDPGHEVSLTVGAPGESRESASSCLYSGDKCDPIDLIRRMGDSAAWIEHCRHAHPAGGLLPLKAAGRDEVNGHQPETSATSTASRASRRDSRAAIASGARVCSPNRLA